MKNLANRTTVILCLALSTAIFSMQAAAQVRGGGGGVLEEVVVTAQKREQNLQDVGIAITAFTGEQMRALGVEESFDIAGFAPSVHISGNLAGQNTQFSIRGVTQNDFNDVIEAPNAMYLDEGYIAIAQAQTFALFDMERVEILKGPQGTLFGRNATGGLVQYVSNKPSFDGIDGYVDFTYGRFDSPAAADQFRVTAAVGGPLSETLAGRVAMLYNQHDGYLENLYPDSAVGGPPGPGAGADLGDDDTIALRTSLLFKPRETLSVAVSANYARTEVATGPYQSKPTTAVYNAAGEVSNVIDTPPGDTRRSICQAGAGAVCRGLLGSPEDNQPLTVQDGGDFGSDQDDNGFQDDFFNNSNGQFGADKQLDVGRPGGTDFFGYLDPDGEDFSFSGDFAFADSGKTETWGLNGRVEWELDNGVLLTSITDYKDYTKLLFIDVDSAPVNQLANYAAVDANSFTQELRLNGEGDNSRWLLGFYYLNIDADSDNGLKISADGVAGPAQDVGTDARLKTDSYSLFGQLEWDLNDSTTLIGGLRLIQEEKDFAMSAGLYQSSTNPRSIHVGKKLLPAGPATSIDSGSSNTLWAGKLQLDYHASDDLLVYVGVNRGVKAGSFNAPLLGAYFSLLNVGAGNEDIPYKEEVLLSYEGGFKKTLFGGHTRLNAALFYYDYTDYQAFLFTGVGGVVINADAETYGAELELQTSPFAGFDAVLSLGWFDATVEDVPLRIGSAVSRNVDPTYAPELQFTAIARYQWPALNGLMHLTGDVSYSDSYFYNLRNFDADKFDSYVMLNLGLGWASEDGHWQARFKINNVTDARAGIQGFDIATACGCNEISFRAPRWYGVNVKYSF